MEVNTGLKIRGFEVWANKPHHYRHYHELFLVDPQVYRTEVRESADKPSWKPLSYDVGYQRADGVWCVWFNHTSRATAERSQQEHPTARHGVVLVLDAPANPGGGVTWWQNTAGAPDERFNFTLTASEVEEVRKWRDAADSQDRVARADWYAAEAQETIAQAHAAAMAGLPRIPRETECLECGAVYQEPGHVESGGMSCDRCG